MNHNHPNRSSNSDKAADNLPQVTNANTSNNDAARRLSNRKIAPMPDGLAGMSRVQQRSSKGPTTTRRSIFGMYKKETPAYPSLPQPQALEPLQEEDSPDAIQGPPAPRPFWRSSSLNSLQQEETQTQPNPSQADKTRRASSITIPDRFKCPGNFDIDIREFTPPNNPREIVTMVKNKHFKVIDDLPELSFQQSDLPPLPTPLQRFYSDGWCTTMGGAYPLVKPKSILKVRNNSERIRDKIGSIETPKVENEQEDSNSDEGGASKPFTNEQHDAGRIESLVRITRSVCDFSALLINKERNNEKHPVSDTASLASSMDQSKQNSVRFDPRVTVTEFVEGNDANRQWYSESQLERFQLDAILLAQQYFVQHPQKAREYSKGFLDPITKTVRRRAMYSVPILSSTFEEADVKAAMENEKKAMEALIQREVQNILIVDPDVRILELFCKSLRQLFSYATIKTAVSGEQAIKMIMEGNMRFDIVIAEERLPRPSVHKTNKTTVMQNDRSANQLQQLAPLNGSVTKTPSLQGLTSAPPKAWLGMTGSELFHKINVFQRQQLFVLQQNKQSRTTSVPIFSLLIGVSVNPDQDRAIFTKHGKADLVWGKPPPKMTQSLRNKLVVQVIKKRQQQQKSIADENAPSGSN